MDGKNQKENNSLLYVGGKIHEIYISVSTNKVLLK